MSTNTQVPKVTISEIASSLPVPQANQVVIWIIGTSEKGTANKVEKITSVSVAESIFGSNVANWATLVSMIKKAFQEWASVVKAVSIGSPTLDAATSGSEGALTADSAAGSTTVTVADATIYSADDIVYLWTGSSYDEEERLVVATGVGSTLTFTTALKFAHYEWELARIITPKVAGDYTNAINALEQDEDKSIVVCENNASATVTAIRTMCDNSAANYNAPCVYIQGCEIGETATTAIAKAAANNDERVILPFPFLTEFNWRITTGWETAAALAGVIAGNGVPKLNHNFSDFTGFWGVSEKISDMDALLNAGITPIELKYSSIHIVRLLTTRTTTSGVPDSTWKEAAVRLNVDFIEKSIAREVQKRYLQKGNTAQVRDSIKETCKSMLDVFATNNIIIADEVTKMPAYSDPVVTTDSVDSTKVNVDMMISPWKPLNFISLNFKVFI